MYPITSLRRRAGGFTLIEMMVAVAILSVMLAVGIPSMSKWMAASRSVSAAEFYAEGLKMARAEAVKRNAVSRLTLVPNTTSGQYDWQVDICMPTPTVLCRDDAGSWSTPTTVATGTGLGDYKSVVRSSSSLPKASVLALSIAPIGANEVYFTSIGWVDSSVADALTRITLAPAAGNTGDFPTSAVTLTLAGVVFKCDPTVVSPDSRACP